MVPPRAGTMVLFVCTANVCRSPMAAALLANRVHNGPHEMQVRSAGVRALREPADTNAQNVLAARGLDLSRHESRALTSNDIAAATLVLTMERAHVAAIAAAVPAAFGKTFGLTEIVALGAHHGGRRPEETIEAWIARLQAGRRPDDVLRADAAFDVADPHGGAPADYERCAERVAQLVEALVILLNDRGTAGA